MSQNLSAIVAGGATVNALLAQVSPGVPALPTLEWWLASASKLGATAILGLACYVLWRQLRREQDDNVKIREKLTEKLSGVIEKNTIAIERVEQVISKCNDRR